MQMWTSKCEGLLHKNNFLKAPSHGHHRQVALAGITNDWVTRRLMLKAWEHLL